MPQAKKSTRSRSSSTAHGSSRAATFKEPAALKRLTKSLESAQDALGDLRKDMGRDAGTATRDLQKQLRTALTGSRRDIGKLVRALQRDFNSAQSKMSQSGAGSAPGGRSTRGRSTSGRGASARGSSGRSSTGRSASTGSRGTRSSGSRARNSKST